MRSGTIRVIICWLYMKLYFFHILRKGEMIRDEEGTALPDLGAARSEAKASARDIAREAIVEGSRPADLCVEIHDRHGRILASLSVGEIVEHPDAPAFEQGCIDTQRILH